MLPDSGSVRPVVCIGLVQKVALIPLILQAGHGLPQLDATF